MTILRHGDPQVSEPTTAGSGVESESRYRWVALVLGFLSQWSNSIIALVLAPLAPIFQSELGLTRTEVGLFATAGAAGAWGTALAGGLLTDRFGVRRAMSAGLILSGVLMSLVAGVTSAWQAAILMFAAGAARGTVSPAATKAIMDWFPVRTRATAMSVKQLGLPSAGFLAGTILPTLGLALGWRAAVAIPGLLIVADGIATAWLYRDAPRSAPRLAGFQGMRMALRHLAGNPGLWILATMACLYLASQQAAVTYMALYFNEVLLPPVIHDESTRIVTAGGFLAVCQIGGLLGRPSWGMVSDRLFGGRRGTVLVVIGITAGVLLAVLGRADSTYPLWLLAIVVFGVGATAVGWNGVYYAMLVEMVGPKSAATAAGLAMTVSEIGVVTGPPLFGLVADAAGYYEPAWLTLSALSGLGTALAIIASRRERR